MFKPTKKQISAFIGSTVLLGIVALLAYAAVFFTPSKQPIGYVGQPTMSNYNITSGNEHVYRGMYNNYDWTGQFTCYPVNSVGYVDLNNPCFPSGASSPLDTQAVANTRLIGTLTDSTTSPTGVEFSTAGLTSTQQTTLGGTTNINWLRGQAQTGLRTRTTVLGDIIHSRPYYYTDGTNPTVFVGANDGMLHAFDATTGQERWAYVPSMLIPKMGALTSTTYNTATHDYFVDGSIAINTSVPIAGTATPVLVGALGAGGKGLYALNISSLTPTTGLAVGQQALWEITPDSVSYNGARTTFTCTAGAATAPTGSYCNMGYTYSNPVVVPTQDGNISVIVGNGYNNTGNGHATLYVINAKTGALIREIDTGSGTTTNPNGLSSPTVVDSNGDGKADRVYAGDINGNMWVFNLSSATPANWSSAFGTPPSTSPQPFYSIPQGTAAEPIAITQAPAISVHPYGGFMVNFATGRILSGPLAAVSAPSTTAAIDDTSDTTTPYAAYGLWDNLSTTVPSGSLISQTLAATTYSSTSVGTVPVAQVTTNNHPNWTGANPDRGWTVPLYLQGGERVIGDGGYVDSGKFQFSVTNPTVSFNPAGSSTGSSGLNWLFDLDFLSGGPGTAPFIDMNQDGLINNSDLIGNGTSTAASAIPVAYITSNGVQSQPILVQLANARIPLYNQNYNTPSIGPTSGTGVNGGHFDVDIFYWTGTVAAPAQCVGGTLNNTGTGCTGVCTGGTLNAAQTACTINPATCTGGTLNSGSTACAVVGTYAPAVTVACTGGTLNGAKTACTAPGTFTAAVPAKCTGGTLNSGSTACAVVGTYVPAAPASCSGGTLNSGGTACTAPGTYVAAAPSGTYSTVGTYIAAVTAQTGSFQKVTHVHEYDKIFDTNGLNPLNPNNLTYPLSTVKNMTSTTPYKVLVMNQAWNRAMNLRIGTWSGSTRDYQTMLSTDILVASAVPGTYYNTSPTNLCTNTASLGVGCLNVNNLPSFTGTTSNVGSWVSGALTSVAGTDYQVIPSTSTTDIAGKIRVVNVTTNGTIGCTGPLGGTTCTSSLITTGPRATVGGLELSMPYDGYNIKDWWADGDHVVQTGVLPALPNCAYGVNSDGSTQSQYVGTNGERHDGVLTVQLIKANTPNSAVQMNVPGQAIYGFRVIDSLITTYVLAEYTLYWHHPNAECMGDTQTWATTNNPGDPWWPAEEVWNTTASCTSGYVSTSGGGSCKACPTGQTANTTAHTCSGGATYQTAGTYKGAFVSSTANSSSRPMGTLTCVNGGPSNASGPAPTWNVTATANPPTAFTAANTSPYTGAIGSSSAGPAGWTMSPPQDTATTLPICPTYAATRDDPRTASFINNLIGTPGTSGVPGTTVLTSGMGGVAYSAGLGSSNGGGGASSGVGSSGSSVPGTTNYQTGAMPTAHRITWRELIGL